MYLVSALYAEPADREAFDSHYLKVHRKIAERLPGIVHFTVSWPQPATAGDTDPIYCIALMYWDSRDAAMAALSGPVGVEAMDDMPNFAAAGATILMASTEAATPFPAREPGHDRDLFSAVRLHELDGPPVASPGAASYTVNRTEPGPDGGAPAYQLVEVTEWDDRQQMAAASTAGPAGAEGRTTTLVCRSMGFV
jgi:uncharacterized protein (TIGR02118 family)